MKVQVNVKTLTGDIVDLNLVAGPEETVQAIKARIALAEPNPFPDQSLSYKGALLQDDTKLSCCGIEDGGVLDFSAQASEEAFAHQLEELLYSKGALPVEELGLLYSLTHGVTAGHVLKAVGKDQLLGNFVERLSKRFVVEGSTVKPTRTLAAETAELQPSTSKILEKIPEDVAVQNMTVSVSTLVKLPYASQVDCVADLRVCATDTVLKVKSRIFAATLAPFADQELTFKEKVLDDSRCLVDYGVVNGSHLSFVVNGSEAVLAAQLAALLCAKGSASRVELDNMYCCRHGVSATQALQMLGWGEKLNTFLQRQSYFSVKGGCVTLVQDALPAQVPMATDDNHKYLALDAELCSKDLSEKFSQDLDCLAETLSAETFLNVSRVEKGGGVAKGTAIPGAPGAELVLLLEGLTIGCHATWLPSLSKSVAASLNERLCGQNGIANLSVSGGSVHVSVDGPLRNVKILFSPAFKSYSEALNALRCDTSATACAIGRAAFVTQRVRFVEKQSEGVKATMRLLKWWREQRQWSSEKTRPSDDLLELVVAHAVTQRTPRNLQAAVSDVLSILAHFDEMSAIWPLAMRSYREDQVPKSLLSQRPLLLDPTNPFANVADPKLFCSDELMEHARSGVFFM